MSIANGDEATGSARLCARARSDSLSSARILLYPRLRSGPRGWASRNGHYKFHSMMAERSACRWTSCRSSSGWRKLPQAEQANWKLEPGGFAIYWPDLDDGIEVCHLLTNAPID